MLQHSLDYLINIPQLPLIMPRTSKRRRFIKRLSRNLQQRKSLLAISMLSDDSGSSSDDSGGSSSSRSDTGAIIYAAAYNSSKEKLAFAEKSRYLFRTGYRKSNQDVFIKDLNAGSDDERPWLTDEEFKKKYRMSREALDFIADKIKDDKVFKNKRGPKQMNPKHQLMVLLDYLGTEGCGANLPKQRAYFKIGHGSVKNCRKRALKAILRSLEGYYEWPDEHERRNIAKCFKKEFDLPNCVGVMDGTLFPLEFAPEKDPEDYHGRKYNWSLTCLVVSDQKRRIRWYVSGYPGSAHDNRMLRKSPLKLDKEEWFGLYEYIICDTAFDPSENVVPAYKASPGQTEPADPDERLFNGVMTTPRVSSEHVNGMWKGRFPWLRMVPNKIKSEKTLKDILKYIHCTVLLHNLLIEFGDEHVQSWEREDDRLSDIADPRRVPPFDDMPEEERMLYTGVPDGAAKDWRRATLKEYLREHHAAFELERRARVDDESSGDEDMEDLDVYEKEFELYFNRQLNNNIM